MIGVAPGANAQLTADDVDRYPDDLFHHDRVLLVAGLEIPLAAVARAVRRASLRGMTVVLNPAPVIGGLRASGILDLVDVVTPNRIELGQLTGIDPEGQLGLIEAAKALIDGGQMGAVVTLGREGCMVLPPCKDGLIQAYDVGAIDTVGAGDAFSGALAVALAEKRTLARAAGWATAAAALATTKPGAQTALPSRAEIDWLYSHRPDPH